MDAWGFTETLSCFLGCILWEAPMDPCPPQLSSCFSQCEGICVLHHHQQPPLGCFWGLLEEVGSVLTSQSWLFHLNPVPAALLDFGARLWMGQGEIPKKEEMFV